MCVLLKNKSKLLSNITVGIWFKYKILKIIIGTIDNTQHLVYSFNFLLIYNLFNEINDSKN